MILNLGCGSRTSSQCLNVDWSPYLRLKQSRFGSRLAPVILRGERRERFRSLDDSVVVHDLRRRLPVADGSADAVYHSHVLEHFDRERVGPFLAEVRRVLRVGGVHRVVVPDLEAVSRQYLSHLDACLDRPEASADHDRYVGAMIEQMVRREPTGASSQSSSQRFLENLLLGDARRRGETHQWMYDRANLSETLARAGFHEIKVVDHRTSAIPGWHELHLDQRENGDEYIPGSLYIEGLRGPADKRARGPSGPPAKPARAGGTGLSLSGEAAEPRKALLSADALKSSNAQP